MKNICILIICMILCVSCTCIGVKNGKCRVNYSVVYPDTTITYDTIFYYEYDVGIHNSHTPYVSSSRGTNYIKLGMDFYNRTTCPIRINSYKTISKNDN